MTGPGYHLAEIPKGKLGELSKIQEELDELRDAMEQGSRIMALVELSDLVGAVEEYLRNYFPGYSIVDLQQFSTITKRAFKNGHRQSSEPR